MLKFSSYYAKSWLWLLFQVNDTLDDIFNDSDEEQESQDIVNQVLDEIGIEISGKVWRNVLVHPILIYFVISVFLGVCLQLMTVILVT